jgi:hypothetical protein
MSVPANPLPEHIFHICAATDWQAAQQAGVYRGSAQARADGFLHLSTAETLAGAWPSIILIDGFVIDCPSGGAARVDLRGSRAAAACCFPTSMASCRSMPCGPQRRRAMARH